MSELPLSEHPAAGSVEPQTPAGATSAPTIDTSATAVTAEMQRAIYELVKARVLQSIGAGANWTVAFRTSADTDTFFSDTMADMIAWDVAHQLAAPTVPNRARLAS